jgi:hypothetical protein
MSAVVALSLPGDEARVRPVIEALHAQGIDLWWQRMTEDTEQAPTGPDPGAARVLLLFWTEASADPRSAAYQQAARQASVAGKSVSVLLDRIEPPAEVEGRTLVDLTRWRGRSGDLALLDLAAALKAKAAGLEPAPPRGPARQVVKRMALVIPIILLAIGVAADLFDIYGGLGLRSGASDEEERDWARVRPGVCDDLRTFVDKHGAGAHAAEASALLAARRVWVDRRFRREAKPLPLTVQPSAKAQPDSASARQWALDRAAARAASDCEDYAVAGVGKVVAVETKVEEWRCGPAEGGTVCGLEGKALCSMEVTDTVERERCGS